MAYLEQKKCIHRDLAARNISIDGHHQIKIGGFHRAILMNGDEYLGSEGQYLHRLVSFSAEMVAG